MKYIYFTLLAAIVPRLLLADVCPTTEKVKERKISLDYEWTIDERRTLDDVLSVEKLYSARIQNKGEFISCYYSGTKGLLRLDGKPEKGECRVQLISGLWEPAETDGQVCREDNIETCVYEINCE